MQVFRLGKMFLRGFYFNRWATLLVLISIIAMSLACSSGGDFIDGTQISSRDVFNDPLPASFDDQFKPVDGGQLAIRGTYDEQYIDFDGELAFNSPEALEHINRYEDFDPDNPPSDTDLADNGNQELGDSENDAVTIDAFHMMKTEVTIEMFVDFLNSIAFKQDELTNAGDGETTSFTDPDIIYKPIMQSENTCGIYRFEFGERANDEISNFSGFTIEDSSSKPQAFTDPFINIQKPRSASENQSSSFEVAPGRDTFPMVYVSQSEAKEFCRWLGAQYRLPTWQEWTWAAQGGELSYQFPTSDGNLFLNGLKVANFRYNSGQNSPSKEVGTTGPPNPFGLFDMAGNVYEWTYFKAEDSSNATVPYDGGKFLMGGGYKTKSPSILATWFRFGLFTEGTWTDDLGFRVIFDVTRGNSAADDESSSSN